MKRTNEIYCRDNNKPSNSNSSTYRNTRSPRYDYMEDLRKDCDFHIPNSGLSSNRNTNIKDRQSMIHLEEQRNQDYVPSYHISPDRMT